MQRDRGFATRFRAEDLDDAAAHAGVTKTVTIHDHQLCIEYALDEAAALETTLNLAMPSCDGFLGRYVLDGGVAGGFGQTFAWSQLGELHLEDDVLRGKVVLHVSRPVTIHAAAHCTVSQSEGGFEKIMQAVALRLVTPEPVSSLRVSLTVS